MVRRRERSVWARVGSPRRRGDGNDSVAAAPVVAGAAEQHAEACTFHAIVAAAATIHSHATGLVRKLRRRTALGGVRAWLTRTLAYLSRAAGWDWPAGVQRQLYQGGVAKTARLSGVSPRGPGVGDCAR